jgi:hypothetical protein
MGEYTFSTDYNFRDQEKFKRRLVRVDKFLNEVFARTSRVLVIRLDLGYGQYSNQDVGIDKAMNDVARLRIWMQSNSQLYDGFLGFIRKLEWTPEKGLHHHVLFAYDERLKQNDVYLAHLLGEYWKNVITQGDGIFWNCNEMKDQYEWVGIGRVHRNDEIKRRILLNKVAAYLTKVDQIPAYSGGRRLFDYCLRES